MMTHKRKLPHEKQTNLTKDTFGFPMSMPKQEGKKEKEKKKKKKVVGQFHNFVTRLTSCCITHIQPYQSLLSSMSFPHSHPQQQQQNHSPPAMGMLSAGPTARPRSAAMSQRPPCWLWRGERGGPQGGWAEGGGWRALRVSHRCLHPLPCPWRGKVQVKFSTFVVSCPKNQSKIKKEILSFASSVSLYPY